MNEINAVLTNKIRALACALNVLRGTDGGYTSYEKDNTIIILQKMYDDYVKELNR